MYQAILRSMGSKYISYGAQFASLAVLARLFPPEVFGKVAAVQVFLVFFQLLAEGGLSPAVIGLHTLGNKERNGIFGVVVLLGIALAAIFFSLTPLLQHFYEVSDIGAITPYIAVGICFSAWAVLPLAFLQRQQMFFLMAQAGVLSELAGLGAALYLYWHGGQVQALAIKFAITPFVYFASLYYFSSRTDFGRPSLGSHFGAIKPLIGVAGYQLAFNTVNYFSRNLDKILVGKYLGVSQLGLYDRSYALMRYPLQLLAFAMAPAIQPALRAHSDRPDYVFELHLDLARKLALVGTACAAFIYIFAKDIVYVVFGSQWSGVVPIIKILSLTVPAQVVLSTCGSFFQTFQRTDLLFRSGLFSAIVNVCAIFVGIFHGNIETLCWALFFSFHINFVQAYYILHKSVFYKGFRQFMKAMLLPATLLAFLTLWAIFGKTGLSIL